jgi:hypothetical protein
MYVPASANRVCVEPVVPDATSDFNRYIVPPPQPLNSKAIAMGV